jgi:hypothetical protein
LLKKSRTAATLVAVGTKVWPDCEEQLVRMQFRIGIPWLNCWSALSPTTLRAGLSKWLGAAGSVGMSAHADNKRNDAAALQRLIMVEPPGSRTGSCFGLLP